MGAAEARVQVMVLLLLVGGCDRGIPTSASSTLQASTAATRLSEVDVVLKSQNTIGTRPDGSIVLIDIKLEVSGSTLAELAGTGRHLGSGGLHADWDVGGGVLGYTLTLTGTVREASDPVFIGSPVQVTADLTSEEVTFRFGPLTGGRFAGQTIVTQGPARIQIRDDTP